LLHIIGLRILIAALMPLFGSRHPRVVERLCALGKAAKAAGKANLAERTFRQALEIEDERRPVRPAVLASILAQTGIFYLTPKRAGEAKAMFERALTLSEEGADRTDLVPSLLDGLAQACRLLNEDAQAEPLRRHALALCEAALGPDHQEVLNSVTRLAQLVSDLGRYEEAESLFARVVETQERLHGPENLELAAALDNLAILLDQKGEFAKSEVLYRRVAAIERAIMNRPGLAHVQIDGHRPAGPVESSHAQE